MASYPLWLGAEPVVLASASGVRRRLLEAAGIPVEVERSDVDERAVEASLQDGVGPAALAAVLAREKAIAVSRRRPGRVVIGADQVLEADGRTWPKPVSAADAREQLARLAGGMHVLHSALAIVRDGRIAHEGLGTARLTMRALGPGTIAAYVAAAGEAATRSAGGYEVEGLGIHLFETIEGEHSTILGLPLLPTLSGLRAAGVLAL